MLMLDNFGSEPYNHFASVCAKYTKDTYYVKPNIRLCGPVLLLDDIGDMTMDKYAQLREIIQAKKQKELPLKLRSYSEECLDGLKKELAESTNKPSSDTFIKVIVKPGIEKIETGLIHYGDTQ